MRRAGGVERRQHLGCPGCGTSGQYADRPAGPVGTRGYAFAVSEYQITWWRELPSLVVVRSGPEPDADLTKSPLAARFQEAIDEAAMRLGDTDSTAYLDGWRRSPWTATDELPIAAADRLVAELEATWTPEAVGAYLDSLGPAQDEVRS
jgi:hypothetical protein